MFNRALVGLIGLVAIASLALAACDKEAPPSAAPPSAAPAATPSPTATQSAPLAVDQAPSPCGMRFGDWCPSAPNDAGDACGKHKNVEECRADTKCKGMPYRGESLVACKYDDAGFATNCPTVGCISR